MAARNSSAAWLALALGLLFAAGCVGDDDDLQDDDDVSDDDDDVSDDDDSASSSEEPSEALIDEALRAGEIDAETALIYKVWSAFADERLPAPFRGDDTWVSGSLAPARAVQQWPELSVETRAALRPFLLPPTDADSWFALRSSGSAWPMPDENGEILPPTCTGPWSGAAWQSADTPLLRVWYVEDAAQPGLAGDRAAEIADTLGGLPWTHLTDLMQEQPMPDQDAPCGGGDPRLDVYFLDYGAVTGSSSKAMVLPYYADPVVGTCAPSPSFMLVNSAAGAPEAPTLAHEFMHVLQYTRAAPGFCPNFDPVPGWFMEAAAVWAALDVYPQEQTYAAKMARDYLRDPSAAHWALYPWFRGYRSSLFLLFLTERDNDPDLIRRLLDQASNSGDTHGAFEDLLPGGWTGAMAEFAAALHNVDEDGALRTRLGETEEVTAGDIDPSWEAGHWGVIGAQDLTVAGGASEHFKVAVPSAARLVAVRNSFAELGDPKVRVTGRLQRDDGSWGEPEDWTARPWILLCGDVGEEPVGDSFFISISNGEATDLSGYATAPGLFAVLATDLPCGGFSGTAQVLTTTELVLPGMVSTTEESAAAEVLFELDEVVLDYTKAGDVGGALGFRTTSGSVTWSGGGSLVMDEPPLNTSCEAGPVLLPVGSDGALAFALEPKGAVSWTGVGQTPVQDVPWVDCWGDSGFTGGDGVWFAPPAGTQPWTGSTSLVGSWSDSQPVESGTIATEASWSLSAVTR